MLKQFNFFWKNSLGDLSKIGLHKQFFWQGYKKSIHNTYNFVAFVYFALCTFIRIKFGIYY